MRSLLSFPLRLDCAGASRKTWGGHLWPSALRSKRNVEVNPGTYTLKPVPLLV